MKDLITSTTLYYFLSTVSQVLAATTAIIFVVLQFKIGRIKQHLIGDGKAAYERIKIKEDGYANLPPKQANRLRDSIAREDLNGIQAVFQILSEQEKQENLNIEERPRGLQWLHQSVVNKIEQINKLNKEIRWIVIVSFVTIVLSTGLLSFVEILIICEIYGWLSMLLIFLLFAFSLLRTFIGVRTGTK